MRCYNPNYLSEELYDLIFFTLLKDKFMTDKVTEGLIIRSKSRRFLVNKPPLKVFYVIARQLKIKTTAISILDGILNRLTHRIESFKLWQEAMIPAWGNAIFYMLPSIVVWARMAYTWYKQKPP